MTKTKIIAALILLPIFQMTAHAADFYWAVVRVPVADVRSASGTLPSSHDYDPNEETQLLYGEPVKVVEESGDWLRIEAIEQMEYSHHNRWEGYPGWIEKKSVAKIKKIFPSNCVVFKKNSRLFSQPDPKSDSIVLSLGTKLIALDEVKNGFRKIKATDSKLSWIPQSDVRPIDPTLSENDARRIIIESASKLIGDPYFWGGRSAQISDLKNQVTAVDCSGLVNLAYRAAGIDIPRDSLEQHMKAQKIKPDQLKTGDLIFSASKEKPEKISHVAIYIDSMTIMEAPKTGEVVRKIEFEKKYGAPIDQVQEGQSGGERVLYFGTFFPLTR